MQRQSKSLCLSNINAGIWSPGFRGKIGSCNIVRSEIWALREGLNLGWSIRIPRHCVLNDSKEIVDLIEAPG